MAYGEFVPKAAMTDYSLEVTRPLFCILCNPIARHLPTSILGVYFVHSTRLLCLYDALLRTCQDINLSRRG
jgi:hypothetical protein